MVVFGVVLATGTTEAEEMWYHCKYCGHKARDVGSLTGSAVGSQCRIDECRKMVLNEAEVREKRR